jgi:tetratricopeptide (TPR) repeat protein
MVKENDMVGPETEEDVMEEEDEEEEEDLEDGGDTDLLTARDSTVLADREKILRTALVAVSKRSTESFNCWFHLGLMYFRTQMYSKAKDSFQRSLEALRTQASRYPKKIDLGRFATLEARALSLVAQCSIYELSAPGFTPSESHNPQVIQEQFINATKLDNMQPDIWNNIGLLHMSLDKFEGASAILKPILLNFPQYNDAMSNLGLTHLCKDDLSEAAKHLQAVILRDANHLEALNNYGVLLLRHHSYHNAAIFFEKTVDIDPSSYVWSNLACAYSAAGRLSDAARAFRHARELDESNAQVLRSLLALLVKKNTNTNALLQATCNLAHHITAVSFTEADPLARAKKLEQAEHMYSTVVCEQKSSTHAWTGLASVFKTLH